METPNAQDVTSLLNTTAPAEREKLANKLMPLVYDDLHRLAENYFRHERPDHTLQPTALVNEAYLRLVDQSRVNWEGRSHFFATCAKIMRQILVDHARGRRRARRGGGRRALELDSAILPADMADEDLLGLNDALEKLAQLDERQARVVELRFFAGMNMDEIAQFLNVSKRTVEGDWTHAKAWLKTELESEPPA